MSAPIIAAEQCGPLWGRECEGSAPFSHTQIHTNVPLQWTKAAKEPHEGENVWLYFLFFYFLALWVIYGWLRAGWAGRPPRFESGSWNPSHVQSLRCALSAGHRERGIPRSTQWGVLQLDDRFITPPTSPFPFRSVFMHTHPNRRTKGVITHKHAAKLKTAIIFH